MGLSLCHRGNNFIQIYFTSFLEVCRICSESGVVILCPTKSEILAFCVLNESGKGLPESGRWQLYYLACVQIQPPRYIKYKNILAQQETTMLYSLRKHLVQQVTLVLTMDTMKVTIQVVRIWNLCQSWCKSETR